MHWTPQGTARLPLALVATFFLAAAPAFTQEEEKSASSPPEVTLPAPPQPTSYDHAFPINLPTALQLANSRPLDVQAAAERIRLEAARLERERVLWLPTVLVGGDYFRHDGQLQDIRGEVFGTSRSALLAPGVGATAVFATTDALFAPLAARRVTAARQASLQAATNDSMLEVAEAYFNVQQARGELAGYADVVRRAEELVRRVEKLAPGLVPALEQSRAKAELARRRQPVHAARERWRLASADLVRVLRLDPLTLVEPLEPPHLTVTLIADDRPVDDLVATGLLNRPELASQRALVEATLARLRQEKLRPLLPSVLLRGAATNPAGTLAAGYFGGGVNDDVSKFSARQSWDVQVLWELQNLGLGNRGRVQERESERRLALIELFRIQDRVAAEVVRAHAEARSAADRHAEARQELEFAADSVAKNFEGLEQTKRAGNLLILVTRPQEVLQSIQALAQAYQDYYGSANDFNRAQFRLYRAMGQPAQMVLAGNPAQPDEACGAGQPNQ